MKTKTDLNALIPQIVKMVIEDPQIGDGEYLDNVVSYDKDGWDIEISFQCCGEYDDDPGDYWTPPCFELTEIEVEITDISVYHYDEEADEESVFDDNDTKELRKAVEEVLYEMV